MKDRYLVKAKRTDNGEWIEGYYVCFNETAHFIFCGYAETDCGNFYPDKYEIDPSTVCRFTGRVDKKGVRIWENDIVDTLYDIEYVGVSAERIGKTIVVFHDSCFMKRKIGCDSGYYHFIASDKETVIGNVFDNPKLAAEKSEQLRFA